MAQQDAQQESVEIEEEIQWVRPQRSITWRIWNTWKKKPLGLAGVLVIAILLLMAGAAPILTPFGQFEMHAVDRLQGPNSTYWLGTDQFGRDMYTRLVYGARISLFMGFAAVTLGGITGGILGTLSAYLGGKFDIILQRFVDMFQAFPSLILAMAVVAALGFGVDKCALAISVPYIPRVTRITRSQAVSIREREFIMAALAIGATGNRMLFKHMIPNSLAPWLVVITAALGAAIVAEASLSFLGLGVPPPHPSWGGMLSGNVQQYAESAPHMIIWPGVFLSFAVFGMNLFGDAVRDVMDPRLRR
ncbi:MAG: ABC transporter permease [SAR202 cluster bacterium]|nr:ABC transporter permease [SAR202 cluster bacterium]|tara:strand:+ start:926 stop:1837 length:912 start_codon:yes stop_codon:yes gene_type:complete